MGYATLDDIRGRQRTRGFPLIIAVSGVMLLLGFIIGATELIAYSEEYNAVTTTFGDDVTIGGIQVGGLTEADRLATLESVYVEQPITLVYEGSPILMTPQQVGFRLNTEAMTAAANAQLGADYWGGFWDFLWRRNANAIDIPLYAVYDPADIRNYLQQEVAARYDVTTGTSGFDLASFTFVSAAGGTQLDIDASIALIERAMFQPNPQNRVITLPTARTQGRDVTIEDLESAILQYLNAETRFNWNGPDAAMSVFIMDMQTGEEVGINEYLLHDGLSTLKVGILINFFRHRIQAPTAQQKYDLLNAVACSDNGSANTLVDATSEDPTSWADGFRKLRRTYCEAGAVHTQLTTHLFIGPAGEGFVAPDYYTQIGLGTCENANFIPLDTNVATGADFQNQTTAADMGTMMMHLYDCAEYGSGLATIMEGQITQTECQQTIELLRGTNFKHMSELGVPEGTDIAHKVGYFADTGGDVGVVYTPGGDYVFAMYLWENGQPDSSQWDVFGNINRIAYNYFNPDAPLLQTRTPPAGLAGVECVMPQRRDGIEVSLTDITENRFTPEGIPDPETACYGPGRGPGGGCLTFNGWEGSGPSQ